MVQINRNCLHPPRGNPVIAIFVTKHRDEKKADVSGLIDGLKNGIFENLEEINNSSINRLRVNFTYPNNKNTDTKTKKDNPECSPEDKNQVFFQLRLLI